MTFQVAIDFGGSNTKMLVAQGEMTVQRVVQAPIVQPDETALHQLIAQAGLRAHELSAIAVTGGHSRHLATTLGDVPIIHVGEVEAIGRGGLRAAGVTEALVVSLGTGTATVLSQSDQFRHTGGSAVGGGTLIGLGQLLLGTADPREIAALAAQGDVTHVDLTVGDIIGGPVGRIPASFAAAHFGKVPRVTQSPTREDVAAGLCNLIGQAIATTVLGTAAVHKQAVVVLTGYLIEVAGVRKGLEAVDQLGHGNRFRVPPYPGFATALGALGGK